jgi:hypothetical protein
MKWRLHVSNEEKEIVMREYRTCCEACDALIKADKYYRDKGESVKLEIKSEEGHLVFVNKD